MHKIATVDSQASGAYRSKMSSICIAAPEAAPLVVLSTGPCNGRECLPHGRSIQRLLTTSIWLMLFVLSPKPIIRVRRVRAFSLVVLGFVS